MRLISNTNYYLRVFNKLLLYTIIVLVFKPSFGYSSNAPQSGSLKIRKTLYESTILTSLNHLNRIYSLSISGSIELKSEAGLVRVLLLDEENNEYLIFEAYSRIVDQFIFSFEDVSEETIALEGISPKGLKFEIIDGEIYVDEVLYSLSPIENVHNIQQQNKIFYDSIKLKNIRKNIDKNESLWIAGETSISKLLYAEKKRLFGGTENILNTQGFEFYRGGYFEIFSQKLSQESTKSGCNFIENFDWRNRHGANKSSSPYYDGNPMGQGSGWITHLRISQQCSDCWIFGPLAATESMINPLFQSTY